MSAVERFEFISIEEYLASEARSMVKHEYLDGSVYAMAGAQNRQNLIASRLMFELGVAVQNNPCELYNSDTKVRIQSQGGNSLLLP